MPDKKKQSIWSRDLFGRSNQAPKSILTTDIGWLLRKTIGVLPYERSKRVRVRDRCELYDTISLFVQSNMPLVEGLQKIGGVNNYLRYISIRLASDMSKGKSLSESMSRIRGAFKKHEIGMVAAGEKSGNLFGALQILKNYNELARRTYTESISNISYLLVLLALVFIFGTFIIWKILPKFQDIFAQLGADLPAKTQTIINISNFIMHNWYLALPIIFILVELLRYFRFLLPFWREFAEGKLLITLGLQVGQGIPLDEVIYNCSQLQSDVIFTRAVKKIFQNVQRGKSLSDSMKNNYIISENTVTKVSVAENSSEPACSLMEIGDEILGTTQYKIYRFTTILEPVLHFCIALSIGYFVVSMYLPMFNIPKLIR